MASGKIIETVITTDVDGVIRGAEKVADSYSDIQDSLKDTAKTGEKSFEKLEDSAKDAAKEVDDAAKNIDRDLTKALDEVEAKAKSTGSGIGKSVKDGTDKAGEGLKDLREESNSTAKESAASFDGSAESIADSFQEIAANAFAGFGPAGAAAGLAAAIGIGIAISKMQELAEANDEAKEKASELAREIYETGGKIDDADIAEKIRDIAFALSEEDNPWTFWKNESKSAIDEVRDATQGLEKDVSKDLFKGLAGDVAAGQRAYDTLTKSMESNRKAAVDHRTTLEDGRFEYDETGKALIAQADAQERQLKKLEEATGASKDAASQAKYYKDVMGESTEAVEKREEAEREIVDAMAERLEAEKRQQEASIAGISSELDYYDSIDNLNNKFKENGATLDIHTEKGRENQRAIIDQAGAISQLAQDSLDAGENIQDVTGKFQAQRDALINQVMPAFGGSREAAEKYIDQVLKTPKETVTTVKLQGEAEVRGALDRLSRPVSVWLKPEAPTETYFQGVLAQLSNRNVPVNLVPRAGGPAAP